MQGRIGETIEEENCATPMHPDALLLLPHNLIDHWVELTAKFAEPSGEEGGDHIADEEGERLSGAKTLRPHISGAKTRRLHFVKGKNQRSHSLSCCNSMLPSAFGCN